MKKNNEYQAIYNLYKEKRNKKVELLLNEYDKNKDIVKMLRTPLQQILRDITTVNIWLDIILTTFFIISDDKNTQKFDKNLSKKLLKNLRKMNKHGNAILGELCMVTKFLQLPKIHNR